MGGSEAATHGVCSTSSTSAGIDSEASPAELEMPPTRGGGGRRRTLAERVRGSKHALRPNEGDQGGAWGMELNDAALAAGVTVLPSGPGLDVVVGNAGEEPDDEEAGELSD